MDCNKDEAIRAKEIAERKVVEKDYTGAKKFAVKAQSLYPRLDGLSQILTTIDVYISAEKKLGGEVDWYSVLDVSPWADDEAVRKQYRKLALMLHPDKNKSVGADGAFKLVSEAWSLLSDKGKRLEYNQKLNIRTSQQNVPTQSGAPPAPPNTNGFHSSSSRVASNVRTQNESKRMGSSSVPPTSHHKPDTFWTICNKCRTQYEYLRIYLNHTLLCPNCQEAFQALEKAPPPSVFMSTNQFSHQHQNSRNRAAIGNPFDSERNFVTAQANLANKADFQWGTFGTTAASHSAAAQAASVVQQAQENVRRDRDQAWAAAEWEQNPNSRRMGHPGFKVERQLKKKKTDYNSMNWYGGEMASRMAMGSGPGWGGFQSGIGSFQVEGNHNSSGINFKPDSKRELSYAETRKMLMKRATDEISKKLKVWRLEEKTSEKEKAKEKETKKQKNVVNGNIRDLNDGSALSNKEYQSKKFSSGSSDDYPDKGATATMSINVPDPDFHNFDLDRTERSFGDDQVWAAYDEDDGMPRYYARIHKVMSLKPFKMRISWLNSRTNCEFGPLNWVGSGFTKTCGHFRTGKHEVSEMLNSFSHQVMWTKGARGAIHIFPRKGDVWALYRNWSPDWDERTSDEVIHKYEMVEVLDDYGEEQGVSVTPLVKVAGFRTVFQKHANPKEVRRIPKEEMFRFSHQVPNYLLTGQEAPNAPMGCRELDPAATPVELLQVITETNDDQAGEDMSQTALMDVDKSVVNASEANVQT